MPHVFNQAQLIFNVDVLVGLLELIAKSILMNVLQILVNFNL